MDIDISQIDEDEEFKKMTGFLLEFSQFFDDQHQSNQRKVDLWEDGIKKIIAILKEIMAVSERNAKLLSEWMDGTRQAVQDYMAEARAGRPATMQAPYIKHAFYRIDIASIVDRLTLPEEDTKPDFQMKSIKPLLLYLKK